MCVETRRMARSLALVQVLRCYTFVAMKVTAGSLLAPASDQSAVRLSKKRVITCRIRLAFFRGLGRFG